jgi:nucleoside-diphosphate-sugar epimerase
LDIAVFGATSTIAKEYVQTALSNSNYNFSLFSRSIENINIWRETLGANKARLNARSYDDFSLFCDFDVIINFIGRGDPQRLKQEDSNFLIINDLFDNKILQYLTHHEHSKYIYISSGASYLSRFDAAIERGDQSNIDLNGLETFDLYSVTKKMSEIKHRKLEHLNIVDLRVFSYVQNTNLIGEGSLLGSIFSSIDTGEVFNTNSSEIYRDYINAQLFYEAVETVMSVDRLNSGFDLYSKAYTSKFEVLEMLSRDFGLIFNVSDEIDFRNFNLTGVKKHYYSNNTDIGEFGYSPTLTSLCMIKREAEKLFDYTSCKPGIQ